MIRSSHRSIALRWLLPVLAFAMCGCASTRYALPTPAEKLDFQNAIHGDLDATALLALTEDAIYTHLERFMYTHPELYGSTYALDPAYAGKELAPYVYRVNGKLLRKDLAVGDYDYSHLPWFTLPMSLKLPVWSDEYFDAGGGDIMMMTYSAPIMKDGRAIGVLTADFPLKLKAE